MGNVLAKFVGYLLGLAFGAGVLLGVSAVMFFVRHYFNLQGGYELASDAVLIFVCAWVMQFLLGDDDKAQS